MNFTTASMFLPGEHEAGQDVRSGNVEACITLANFVRTTLGPIGLDKMLVDDIGDVNVTNDGATILKSLAVEHPAAKVLVELSDLQDKEVGDGTTSVVLLAAELLRRANVLIQDKVHPTTVIEGYRLACTKAIQFIRKFLLVKSEELTREDLINVALTSMSSKVLSLHARHFAEMCVDTLQAVSRKVTDPETGVVSVRCSPNSVNVLQAHGQSLAQSYAVDGYALNNTIISPSMPKRITDNKARIAFLDMSLKRLRILGAELAVNSGEDGLNGLNQLIDREVGIVEEKVGGILASGVNVILCTGGIDDSMVAFLAKRGVIGVRRVDLADMRRIARASGGKIISDLEVLEEDALGEDPSEEKRAALRRGEIALIPEDSIGKCREFAEETLGDNRLIFIRGLSVVPTGSVVLRGPTTHMLSELDRSFHDSLCAVSRALENPLLVCGGGAVEAALSVFLENYATTLTDRKGVALREFAKALLVIPSQLCRNAGLDSAGLVASLCASHVASQRSTATPDERLQRYFGLDLHSKVVTNNLHRGVLEPAVSKLKGIQFATEAAITILRIDDVIRLEPEKGQGQQQQ